MAKLTAINGSMLYIDIPTLSEFKALAAVRGDICVSLYMPTSPHPDHAHRWSNSSIISLARTKSMSRT